MSYHWNFIAIGAAVIFYSQPVCFQRAGTAEWESFVTVSYDLITNLNSGANLYTGVLRLGTEVIKSR